MKHLMLIGPSQCGKTSLTQVLRGETLRYQKTQAIVWTPVVTDTSGKYLENRCLYNALLTSACEADVIMLILNVDTPWSPFFPGLTAPMNRPVIGAITKANLTAPPRLQQVRAWLEAVGTEHIFITSVLTDDGLDDLPTCLNAEEYQ